MVDKFKVNGAVARRVLRDLHSKGLVKQVGDHNAHFTLYTGAQAKSDKPVDAKDAPKGGEKKQQEPKEKKQAAPKGEPKEAKEAPATAATEKK